MRTMRFMRPRALNMALRLLAIAVALSAGLLLAQQTASADGRNGFYQQTNLVSDLPGVARVTDPNLVNSWGIVHGPTTPFWIADNGTGVSTLYDGAGNPFPVGSPLVVTIPPPKGSPAGTTAAPTGIVFNPTSGFVVSEGNASGAALFLFATEDGTISGWNRNVDPTHAILEVDKSPAPSTKGWRWQATAQACFSTPLISARVRSMCSTIISVRRTCQALLPTLRYRVATRLSASPLSTATLSSPMPSRTRPSTMTWPGRAMGLWMSTIPADISSAG